MGPQIVPEKGPKSKLIFGAIFERFEAGRGGGADPPAAGGWGPGGGDLGEFTFGKRWGFHRVFPDARRIAALHGLR